MGDRGRKTKVEGVELEEETWKLPGTVEVSDVDHNGSKPWATKLLNRPTRRRNVALFCQSRFDYCPSMYPLICVSLTEENVRGMLQERAGGWSKTLRNCGINQSNRRSVHCAIKISLIAVISGGTWSCLVSHGPVIAHRCFHWSLFL